MITLNIPEQTARNILYCQNWVIDDIFNDKFKKELLEDKMRVKRAMGRALGIPRSMLTDFRLDDMVKK